MYIGIDRYVEMGINMTTDEFIGRVCGGGVGHKSFNSGETIKRSTTANYK